MYKLKDNGVIRIEDNAFIPECNDNKDWQEYQEWLKDGNEPEPLPALTDEEWLNNEVRPKRDELLRDTDFTQLADCPFPDELKARYATYRQKLRNLPETIDRNNPIWPEV